MVWPFCAQHPSRTPGETQCYRRPDLNPCDVCPKRVRAHGCAPATPSKHPTTVRERPAEAPCTSQRGRHDARPMPTATTQPALSLLSSADRAPTTEFEPNPIEQGSSSPHDFADVRDRGTTRNPRNLVRPSPARLSPARRQRCASERSSPPCSRRAPVLPRALDGRPGQTVSQRPPKQPWRRARGNTSGGHTRAKPGNQRAACSQPAAPAARVGNALNPAHKERGGDTVVGGWLLREGRLLSRKEEGNRSQPSTKAAMVTQPQH